MARKKRQPKKLQLDDNRAASTKASKQSTTTQTSKTKCGNTTMPALNSSIKELYKGCCHDIHIPLGYDASNFPIHNISTGMWTTVL